MCFSSLIPQVIEGHALKREGQEDEGEAEKGQRIPSPTEIRWAMAVHAHDPEVFGDLLVLLAWVEVIR